MIEANERTRRGRAAALGTAVVAALAAASPAGLSGQDGETVFKTTCAACHTVGGGRLVGPDLEGVHERREEEWLARFIRGSQAMIRAGDAEAVALAEEYPGLVMPDWPLSDGELSAVLDYVRDGGAAAEGASASAGDAPEASEAQVALGRDLFQGTRRLANGGPACNGCHEVAHDAVIGGGALARDLTEVFTRLGGPGVRAIVGSPPFPVMQRAYADRALTDDEVTALVGFLRRADSERGIHQPRDYGLGLAAAGALGASLLLGLYTLLWRGRRRRSVHHAIYARQVTST